MSSQEDAMIPDRSFTTTQAQVQEVAFRYFELTKNSVGKILTLIEIAGLSESQLKPLKQQVKETLYMNDARGQEYLFHTVDPEGLYYLERSQHDLPLSVELSEDPELIAEFSQSN